MALVSVSQAAKLVPVSRKTVYQYIEDGKLSSTKNHLGKAQIDTSELIRVFGRLQGDMSPSSPEVTKSDASIQEVTAGDNPENAGNAPVAPVSASLEILLEHARLGAENAQLRERLAEAANDKAELQADKERLYARLSEAQATVKLLTHTPSPETEKKSLWARLMGR